VIRVRRATPKDGEDFLKLILMASPYFSEIFSNKAIGRLFSRKSNLFSYTHTFFVELDGKKAGMLLGYDWKTKTEENLRTGVLLFRYLGINMILKIRDFLNLNRKVGKIPEKAYYVSNIAVYPQFRGKGLGKILMETAEGEAQHSGSQSVILDVETKNEGAVSFYKKLGFRVMEEFTVPISGKDLSFFRMEKRLK